MPILLQVTRLDMLVSCLSFGLVTYLFYWKVDCALAINLEHFYLTAVILESAW